MKKLLTVLLSSLCLFGLTACGSSGGNTAAADVPAPQKTEAAAPEQQSAGGKKVLVAYFSYSGQTEKAAQTIQRRTNGDAFKIETAVPYPAGYHDCTETAKKEKSENIHPQLKSKAENIKDYDVVFLGFPIWWYDAPMAVYSFLDAHDLSGKTVISFCTNGGSPISESTPGLSRALANANFHEGARLYPNDTAGTNKWLESLGY